MKQELRRLHEANRTAHAFLCRIADWVHCLSGGTLVLILLEAYWRLRLPAEGELQLSGMGAVIQATPVVLYGLLCITTFYALVDLGFSTNTSTVISVCLCTVVLLLAELMFNADAGLASGTLLYRLTLGGLGIGIGSVSIQYWHFMSFTSQWEDDQ